MVKVKRNVFAQCHRFGLLSSWHVLRKGHKSSCRRPHSSALSMLDSQHMAHTAFTT